MQQMGIGFTEVTEAQPDMERMGFPTRCSGSLELVFTGPGLAALEGCVSNWPKAHRTRWFSQDPGGSQQLAGRLSGISAGSQLLRDSHESGRTFVTLGHDLRELHESTAHPWILTGEALQESSEDRGDDLHECTFEVMVRVSCKARVTSPVV